MVFNEISTKNDKFVCELRFGEVRGDAAHDLGSWVVGKPTVDFLFALIGHFFAVYYSCGVMRRNMYSSAVFAGVDLFSLKFTCTRVAAH